MKNIFLAEDDADDRMFFEDALKEVTIPTELTLSNNGLELMSNLEALTLHPPPHVIFLDLNMPFKDGFQCLQEIRNTVNTTQIDPLSPFQIDPLKNDFKKALKKPAFADRKSDKELLSCGTKIATNFCPFVL